MAALHRLLSLAMAAWLAASPAGAQDSIEPAQPARPQDIAEIDTCLSMAENEGADANRCISVVGQVCLESEQGTDEASVVACMRREASAWIAILKDQWPKMVTYAKEADALSGATGAESRAQTLRKAQDAWLAWRDAECANAFARGQSEDEGPLFAATCLLDKTARRVVEFHYILRADAGR